MCGRRGRPRRKSKWSNSIPSDLPAAKPCRRTGFARPRILSCPGPRGGCPPWADRPHRSWAERVPDQCAGGGGDRVVRASGRSRSQGFASGKTLPEDGLCPSEDFKLPGSPRRLSAVGGSTTPQPGGTCSRSMCGRRGRPRHKRTAVPSASVFKFFLALVPIGTRTEKGV